MMRISWSNRFEPRLSFRVYVLEKEEVGSFCLPASVVSFPMGWRRPLVASLFSPLPPRNLLVVVKSIYCVRHASLRVSSRPRAIFQLQTKGWPPLGILRQHLPAMSCATEITLLWYFFNILSSFKSTLSKLFRVACKQAIMPQALSSCPCYFM